jgi:hypothetical protein
VVSRVRSIEHARAIARKRAEADMTAVACEIEITRMTSPPALDPTSLRVTEAVKQIVYQGKAFFHTLSGTGDTQVGDAGVSMRTTTISVPVELEPVWTTPRVDDVISVTSYPADPTRIGRAYQVVGITDAGAIDSTRQLVCTTWTDSNAWEQRDV